MLDLLLFENICRSEVYLSDRDATNAVFKDSSDCIGHHLAGKAVFGIPTHTVLRYLLPK